MIREATDSDVEAIRDIYNHYIKYTNVSFEEEPVSIREMRSRMTTVRENGLPWLVHVDEAAVNGYAYATRWHTRPAYRYSVESSVYLNNGVTGNGIGSVLYAELLRRLKELKIHAVIGGIALPNPASVALHEKFGFEKVAHYRETGYKSGQWIDVGYWELILG